MPLSEDEQRILKEIEANLTETDPRLVQEVSETTLYRHSARAIKNVRKLGKAGLENLTSSMRTGALKNVFGNAGRRWRERWRRDDPS